MRHPAACCLSFLELTAIRGQIIVDQLLAGLQLRHQALIEGAGVPHIDRRAHQPSTMILMLEGSTPNVMPRRRLASVIVNASSALTSSSSTSLSAEISFVVPRGTFLNGGYLLA